MRKLFGTDGIRGESNSEPMTAKTILDVGRAIACEMRRSSKGSDHVMLIGKDTRSSGYMFETSLAAGLCSMGVDVMLVGPMPTPGIAFLTTAMRAQAGAVISASHNPYSDNGIKFFGPDGYKLSDEFEEGIESLIKDENALIEMTPKPEFIGKASRLEDAKGRYITYLKYNFPKHLTLKNLKIVLDCANGATYKIAPLVFGELGADIFCYGVHPDGININDGCGAVYPEFLVSKVKENHADLGISFDGDGDRLMMVDRTGHVYDGDDLLSILAPWLHARSELDGGVVGTVMSN
ncbi:MAG: phosphoglucosamine mutase, partial [Bdellovibrionales bacterium]|nr:phosphoglucosamine mutase [Bdellovibrionales bacterium]